jgi:hypothetical protein
MTIKRSISLNTMNNTDLTTGTRSHKPGRTSKNMVLGWVHGWNIKLTRDIVNKMDMF